MMDATSPVLAQGWYAILPTVGRGTVVVAGLEVLRRERFLTQDVLAERAGVDRKTVTRAEAGLPIRISNALRLAKALRVKPADLIPQVPHQSK